CNEVELCSCFFFQAEDGIRDFHVTGVQTFALPISFRRRSALMVLGCMIQTAAVRYCGGRASYRARMSSAAMMSGPLAVTVSIRRSEERRVGKEGRSRGWTQAWKKIGHNRMWE